MEFAIPSQPTPSNASGRRSEAEDESGRLRFGEEVVVVVAMVLCNYSAVSWSLMRDPLVAPIGK